MAIEISSSVFDTYNSALNLFTRTATLVYPEKREQCANCYMDTMGTRNRSVSRYQGGGGTIPHSTGRYTGAVGGAGSNNR